MTVKEYYQPQSLDEAVGLLAEHGPSLLVMAGGTIAMPLINEGISMPEKVMGLRKAGLDYMHRSNGSMIIGATTTLSAIATQDTIPLLQQASENAAGWSIRNMGTIGGNIFAPPPAGDVAVALLALDTQVKLVKPGGERVVPLAEFYTGFMTSQLEANELLAEIQVPIPTGKTVYLKYGRKHANTPSIVTVAAHLIFDGETVQKARIGLNGVGPHPLRATNAEAAIEGSALSEATIAAAGDAATAECEPFTDAVATESYRRKMTAVFVRRALTQLAEQEG